MSQHWMIQDDFFNRAAQLRRHFDQQFMEPLEGHAKRFVWDYWHVPEQYSLLRTPAFHYFPAKIYQAWHRHLVQWGREILGCHDISPPWLSCYVDGCEQELHADHPHGPWAFVFSLTPWKRRAFSGGETCLLRPSVMQGWGAHAKGQATQNDHLMKKIAPQFNRLVVFDPRLPHAVRTVRGTRDPRLGRLVLHGWFVQPRPFFHGPLKTSQVAEVIGKGLESFGSAVAQCNLTGHMSLRVQIQKQGNVHKVQPLTSTLVGGTQDLRYAKTQLQKQILLWRFPRASRGTTLTLPIRFGL